jgi:GNAT superfamily N-acetyltransferase
VGVVPRRSRRWVWAGRVVFGMIVAGLVGYLAVVGLDRADKVASSIGAVLALVALGAPYLLPPPGGASMPDPDLSAAAPQARQLAADQHAGSARVVWSQHAPPATDVHRDATCVRVLLAPTGTVGEPSDRHVLALDDCPPAVRSTFADFAGHAGPGMAHLARRWAQRTVGDPILVAVLGGRIVAAIGPMRTDLGPTGDRQLLPQYFAVLPAYRRGGHGRALWRAAQRWGRGAGAAYQLLQTAPGGPADRLYRSEGVDSLGYVCSVTVRSVTA